MPLALRQFVAWITLAQVLLVGAGGSGLHTLFGCEHGCTAACCSDECCSSDGAVVSSCGQDCAYCRHSKSVQAEGDSRAVQIRKRQAWQAGVQTAGCDGCAVCDLLALYHNATPCSLELINQDSECSEAVVILRNDIVAATIRLTYSRGPPVA